MPTTVVEATSPNYPREYDDRQEAVEDAAFFSKRCGRPVIVVPGTTHAWRLEFHHEPKA